MVKQLRQLGRKGKSGQLLYRNIEGVKKPSMILK
jgi:hypothetical protein